MELDLESLKEGALAHLRDAGDTEAVDALSRWTMIDLRVASYFASNDKHNLIIGLPLRDYARRTGLLAQAFERIREAIDSVLPETILIEQYEWKRAESFPAGHHYEKGSVERADLCDVQEFKEYLAGLNTKNEKAIEEGFYEEYRQSIVQSDELREIAPGFVTACSNVKEYYGFIRAHTHVVYLVPRLIYSLGADELRGYLTSAFATLCKYLEFGSGAETGREREDDSVAAEGVGQQDQLSSESSESEHAAEENEDIVDDGLFLAAPSWFNSLLINAESTHQNIFRKEKEGDLWEIRFMGGKTKHYAHKEGFEFLALLLANPGDPMLAIELCSSVDNPKSSVETSYEEAAEFDSSLDADARPAGKGQGNVNEDEILDKSTIASTKAKIKSLANSAAAERELGNDKRADELVAEGEDLAEILHKSRNKEGKSRRFQNKDDKARRRIGEAVKTAYSVLQDKSPALLAHLKEFTEPPMCSGYEVTYRPKTEIRWKTDWN